MAYSVEIWGSHKNEGKDNCITGTDPESLEEAYADLASLKASPHCRTWGYACIEGPEGRVHEETNPHKVIVDDEPDTEFARQQGMLYGVDAYNEAIGSPQDDSDENYSSGFRR